MTQDKNTLMDLQGNHVLGTYAPDLMLVKGEGAWVWDIDGNKYLDFASGISVCNIGHCHPRVTAAIQEDAHAIAVSSYQGGHVEYFKYMLDMLRERGRGGAPSTTARATAVQPAPAASCGGRPVSNSYSVTPSE